MKHRLSITVGLVLFLVLAGTGVGHAYWTAQSSVTASVSAARVSVTQSGFEQLSSDYGYVFSSSTTKPVTVTNGTMPAAYRLSMTAPASNLARDVAVRIWSVTSAAGCVASTNVPGNTPSRSWAQETVVTGSLAAGAVAVWCVRTTLPGLNFTTGSVSAQLSLNATAGAWTSSTVTASATQGRSGWLRSARSAPEDSVQTETETDAETEADAAVVAP